jgi:hypothetical protein
VIVGDVQGKGLAAVETAAVVLGAFREAAHDEPDLVGLGECLERSVAGESEGEKFVTEILAEFGSDHEVVFLNHGQPDPMRYAVTVPPTFPQPPSCAVPFGSGAHGDQHGAFYPLAGRSHLLEGPDPGSALTALREEAVRRHASGQRTTTPRCSCCATTVMEREKLFRRIERAAA